MGYIEESLMPGEKVIYKTSLHWGIILWSTLGFLIAASILGVVIVVLVLMMAAAGNYAICVGFIILLLLLSIVSAAMKPITDIAAYFSTEFGVSDRRVLVKRGVLRRQSLEIVLSQLEGVSIDQDIVGRVIGYGTLVVSGSGGTKQRFDCIASPFELRKHIVEQIEEQEKPKAGKKKEE